MKKFAGCEKAEVLNAILSDGVPNSVIDELDTLKNTLCETCPAEATRKSFGRVLEFLAMRVNKLVGGSSDLTSSNNTKAPCMGVVSSKNFDASYVHY